MYTNSIYVYVYTPIQKNRPTHTDFLKVLIYMYMYIHQFNICVYTIKKNRPTYTNFLKLHVPGRWLLICMWQHTVQPVTNRSCVDLFYFYSRSLLLTFACGNTLHHLSRTSAAYRPMNALDRQMVNCVLCTYACVCVCAYTVFYVHMYVCVCVCVCVCVSYVCMYVCIIYIYIYLYI